VRGEIKRRFRAVGEVAEEVEEEEELGVVGVVGSSCNIERAE
jgi:hypothetical protein